MAMTHVILKEFYVDQSADYFSDYVKTYTDLPFLVMLNKQGDRYTAGRFLRASDLGMPLQYAEWKTIVWDEQSKTFAVPNGTIGHRWENSGNWNLQLNDMDNKRIGIRPALTFLGQQDDVVVVQFPHFEAGNKTVFERGVPVKAIKQNRL